MTPDGILLGRLIWRPALTPIRHAGDLICTKRNKRLILDPAGREARADGFANIARC
jgi:hypothetical protein